MLIESVRVQHFRAIQDATVECDGLTALVGANGSGKSAFLSALNVFYGESGNVTEDDYHGRDTSDPITIAVTYGNLQDEATALFEPYLVDGKLTVECVITWDGPKATLTYHGSRPQHAKFAEVRSLLAEGGRVADARPVYERLRQADGYEDLPAARPQAEMRAGMDSWEAAHPEECVDTRDDGQFFGFRPVGTGYLHRFTRYIVGARCAGCVYRTRRRS